MGCGYGRGDQASDGRACDRDDPIPEVFPEQDPKVDREWEEAKNDPMDGASPSS